MKYNMLSFNVTIPPNTDHDAAVALEKKIVDFLVASNLAGTVSFDTMDDFGTPAPVVAPTPKA